jgi:hypothetical protein
MMPQVAFGRASPDNHQPRDAGILRANVKPVRFRPPTLVAVALSSLTISAPFTPASSAPAARSVNTEAIQRLSVSANRRFLQRADGSPFFWLGDTGWLLFSRLDRDATRRYLDDRRAKGFTVIQVMVLHTADDRAANGALALERGDPARPRVTPGRDPSDQNEYDYWDHVDWVVGEAAARGLYLALVPAWGALARSGALNERNAAGYGTYLARRYGQYPNIVWVVGGDAKGNEQLETWRTLGRTLRAEDPAHLITFHPFGRMQSSSWFHAEPWLDFNMFQSGHRRYDQDTDSPKRVGEDNWRYVLDDYAKEPPKPVLDGEPSYEGIPQGLHDATQPYWTDADARRYAYWSVFAGACGHTYGNNAVMQFHAPGSGAGDYAPRRFWFEAIDDPGAGQMRHLAALMLSRPFFDRVPDPAAVVSGSGERRERLIATRGRDYAMVYSFTGRPFELRLGVVSGASVRAWWYNPRDGSAQPIGLFPNRGTRRFTPPGRAAEGHDWVIVLDDVSRGYAPPGR